MQGLSLSSINVFLWFLFGAVVGFIIHLLDRNQIRRGVFSTVVLGIAGALFGGFISTLLFGTSFLSLGILSMITAIVGGIVVVTLSRAVFKERNYIKTAFTRMKK